MKSYNVNNTTNMMMMDMCMRSMGMLCYAKFSNVLSVIKRKHCLS
ncbi:MAG: hypothetical protein PHW03_07110 [Eubacteriales bacterium]|nr:hypothetical protein [Eubacteriales bacterium]